MTKHERAKLRQAMNAIIADLIEQGHRLTTGQICELMYENCPDLVEESGKKLVNASLANMARSLLKKASKEQDEEMELSFFGNELNDLKIQRCIALPPNPGEREMIWVSTLKATRAELVAYAHHLQAGAAADLVKAKKLLAFERAVGSIAISDDLDVPIEELIQGLREKQA